VVVFRSRCRGRETVTSQRRDITDRSNRVMRKRGTHIQGHSMEDGAFMTDYILLGKGCSVGVDGWMNHGAVMEDGSTLAADGMLMKGEDVPQGATFVGNPARAVAVPRRAAAVSLSVGGTQRKVARETVSLRRFSRPGSPVGDAAVVFRVRSAR
jgi:hypothetical protein